MYATANIRNDRSGRRGIDNKNTTADCNRIVATN